MSREICSPEIFALNLNPEFEQFLESRLSLDEGMGWVLKLIIKYLIMNQYDTWISADSVSCGVHPPGNGFGASTAGAASSCWTPAPASLADAIEFEFRLYVEKAAIATQIRKTLFLICGTAVKKCCDCE